MKLSEVIKNLVDFMGKHGDLECWYSTDDICSGYYCVEYEPVLLYIINKDESAYLKNAYFSLEDAKYNNLDINGAKPICCIC